MILSISDHAMRRYAESNPQYYSHLPAHVSICLTLEAARKARKVVKSIMKSLVSSERVGLTDKKAFWKWMKHGSTKDIFFKTGNSSVFVIVDEGHRHAMVTFTVPPKDNRKNFVYDSFVDPRGSVYMKDITEIVLPWTLVKGVAYEADLEILYQKKVPVRFGYEPKKEVS